LENYKDVYDMFGPENLDNER